MNNKLDQGYENLTKPHIQAALTVRMDQAGITEARLFKVFNKGLKAMLVKIATHEGKITDSREFPNYAIRHSFKVKPYFVSFSLL